MNYASSGYNTDRLQFKIAVAGLIAGKVPMLWNRTSETPRRCPSCVARMAQDARKSIISALLAPAPTPAGGRYPGIPWCPSKNWAGIKPSINRPDGTHRVERAATRHDVGLAHQRLEVAPQAAGRIEKGWRLAPSAYLPPPLSSG